MKSRLQPCLSILAIAILIIAAVPAYAANTEAETLTDSVADPTLRNRLPMPLDLTAKDFVTKVYGIISPDSGRDGINTSTNALIGLVPAEDEYGLWLESADGYTVSYYGMSPIVSARASLDKEKDNVQTFGFFFLFPYDSATHDAALQRQIDFCGALLQEMSDIGLTLALDSTTNDFFDASGEYNGNFVEVHLRQEESAPGNGRYVLTLNVEPRAFSSHDYLTAL